MRQDEVSVGRRACFTGHRIISGAALSALPGRLREELDRLYGEGFRIFYAGGALGFDTLAAEAVLSLKSACPDVRLILTLPCADQARGWTRASQNRYKTILSSADEVVLLSEKYYAGCMQVRNRYMVDHAELCIAYVSHTRGGSVQTAAYALSRGVPLLNLAIGLNK